MTGLTAIAWLRQRMSVRPDSEHGQASVRVAMLAVVLAYLLIVVAGRPEVAVPLRISLQFLAVEFVVAFGILGWIVYQPGMSLSRRVLGMVADYSLMGVGMVLLGELLTPMYVVLMWVTVGNGLLREGVDQHLVALGVRLAARDVLGGDNVGDVGGGLR